MDGDTLYLFGVEWCEVYAAPACRYCVAFWYPAYDICHYCKGYGWWMIKR